MIILFILSARHISAADRLEILEILAECLPAILVSNHAVYLTIIHIERLVQPLTVHLDCELHQAVPSYNRICFVSVRDSYRLKQISHGQQSRSLIRVPAIHEPLNPRIARNLLLSLFLRHNL